MRQPRAEVIVAATLPDLSGPAWAKTRRLLLRRESFRFPDQAQQRLAALGLDTEVLSALLDLESLRRQPWRLSAATRVWELRFGRKDFPAATELEPFLAIMDRAEDVPEMLAGLYLTVKAELVAAYRRYLAETDPVFDTPNPNRRATNSENVVWNVAKASQ